MKLRESGMPEENYWESLFDVPAILDRLGLDASLNNVAELGCGYGTFTLPVAQRIGGVITSTDIEPAMVARTRARASDAGLSNVICRLADILVDGFGVEPDSQDACLLFNILHAEDPVRLLVEAANIVRPGAFVAVIHWRFDPDTPRGPNMEIRPRPQQILGWATQTARLEPLTTILDLPLWHYGIKFRRIL